MGFSVDVCHGSVADGVVGKGLGDQVIKSLDAYPVDALASDPAQTLYLIPKGWVDTHGEDDGFALLLSVWTLWW